MRTVIYSIEKKNTFQKSKSISAEILSTIPVADLPCSVINEGWSIMERDLIKAYLNHTAMIALGKKASKVSDPVLYLELLSRDLLFFVEISDRVNDPKVPETFLRLGKELTKYMDSVKESFAAVSLEFDFFKKVDDSAIVSVTLSILQSTLLNLLAGVTSIMVYFLCLNKSRPSLQTALLHVL
jgi:hypothetical protein